MTRLLAQHVGVIKQSPVQPVAQKENYPAQDVEPEAPLIVQGVAEKGIQNVVAGVATTDGQLDMIQA